LARFTRGCFLHRRVDLAAWLTALIGLLGDSKLTGSGTQVASRGLDSAKVQSVLTTDFPAQAGDSDQIVVRARHRTLRPSAAETAVSSLLALPAELEKI
jgi:hypothetical protein